MKRRIKNNSIHLITLKTTIMNSFEEKMVDISDEELSKHSRYLEEIGKAKKEEKEIKNESGNILNKNTVDDYMDRSGKEVIKSILDDSGKLTDEDIKLMESYEINNKNRPNVLEKLKRGA